MRSRAILWLPCVWGLACSAESTSDVSQLGGQGASAGTGKGGTSGSGATSTSGAGSGAAGAGGASGSGAAGSAALAGAGGGAAGTAAGGMGGSLAGVGGGSAGVGGKIGCMQPGPCDECLRELLVQDGCTHPPEVKCLADNGIFSQPAPPNVACACCPQLLCGAIDTAIGCAFSAGYLKCCAVCDVLRETAWKDKCAP